MTFYSTICIVLHFVIKKEKVSIVIPALLTKAETTKKKP